MTNVKIQRLGLEDADEYYDVFDANRRHIAQHDPRLAESFKTIGSVAEHLSPYSMRSRQHFAVLDEGEFAGSVSLFLHRNQEAEIAYWIDREHICQGLATAACRMLVNYAFSETNTRRIEALIAPTNVPSIKTIERVGFVYSHTLPEDLVYELDGRQTSGQQT